MPTEPSLNGTDLTISGIGTTGDASEVNEDFIEASKSLWQRSKSYEFKRSLGNLA